MIHDQHKQWQLEQELEAHQIHQGALLRFDGQYRMPCSCLQLKHSEFTCDVTTRYTLSQCILAQQVEANPLQTQQRTKAVG